MLLSALLRICIDRKQSPSALFKPGLDRNFASIEMSQRNFLREVSLGTTGCFLPLSELQAGNIRPAPCPVYNRVSPNTRFYDISTFSAFLGFLSPPLSHFFWFPETVHNCNNHPESGRPSENKNPASSSSSKALGRCFCC